MLWNHSSSDCDLGIFVARQLVADNAFLVQNLLFHYCISGVLIIMFFCGMCSGAFICLVLLVNGFPSRPFLRHGFSFTYQHQTDISDQHWSPPGSIIMACQSKNSDFLMLAPLLQGTVSSPKQACTKFHTI
jgi:hypothetical protein